MDLAVRVMCYTFLEQNNISQAFEKLARQYREVVDERNQIKLIVNCIINQLIKGKCGTIIPGDYVSHSSLNASKASNVNLN